ncbi:Conserved_hypothetical protein [Hexamita inflata]|uniref:Uncharacterized protein n=1 Tax=Hexamita inflata TaxID=28002 RepID=A0AA86P0S5_9EUKA|nr:Conserved hypothetical protein [Hexamita inflata]CAI9915414.1 Conserved hypothetical protein [Hexamita inflata]CAI9915417.1 Conserved hypothetical protein [Hexamita inflata]CAI9928887.1 Conserved hypothetical protein [Hexamita inflata]CAI9928890.1 Conserved hypothetical protein [Hexamita inflata]
METESNSIRVTGWTKATPSEAVERLEAYIKQRGSCKGFYRHFDSLYMDFHFVSAEVADQVKADLDRKRVIEGINVKCIIIEGKNVQKRNELEAKMKKYLDEQSKVDQREFIIQLRSMILEHPQDAFQLLQMYPQIGYAINHFMQNMQK